MKMIAFTPLIIIVFYMIGCVSIDPVPFEKFNESLVELDKGASSSLDVSIPLTENRYRKELVDEILQGNDGLLEKISIGVKINDPFYISEPPVFLSAQRFRQGISKINMVWLEYSRLLVRLSSNELVDDNEFTQLSTDLNNNSFNAIQAIKNGAGEDSAEDAALFSQTAISLAKAFIKTKTKARLTESITENQKNIERYVLNMQRAIVTMAQISTQEYSEKQQELKRTFINRIISNANSRNDAAVQKTLTNLVDVKRMHSAQLTSLQALHAAYGRIPEAHQALAKNLKSSDASVAAISALLEKGTQMYASYDSKAKLNKAELVQAKADAASSEAAVVEIQYQQAELKASQARFNYTLAINALNANPDNALLKKDVQEKEVIANTLKLEAEVLKESAIALRAAATAVQENANEVKSSITAN